MSRLHLLRTICSAVGIFFGLVAAYCWLKASTAKVTNKDVRYDSRFDFVLVDDPEDKGHDINFLATAMEQSRLNKIAAIYTAIAVLFQAAASMIDWMAF